MRWKIVFLKKPVFASETIEADAFGALFRSSVTVKSPQLVSNFSVQVFEASSGWVGFFWPPSGFGFGAFAICLQAPRELVVGAGVAVVAVVGEPEGMSAWVLPPLFEPHAVRSAVRSRSIGASDRLIGAGG